MAVKIPRSDLPVELWKMIGERLDSHLDILRFRSVCSTWRSLIPPSLDSLRFFVYIPHPDESSKIDDILDYICQSTIYRLEPLSNDPSSSASSSHMCWLIKIDKPSFWDPKSGPKVQFLNPLSDEQVKYEPAAPSKLLNLLNFRITELCKEYRLEFAWQDLYKILLSQKSWTTVKDCTVMGISLPGELKFWKSGSKSWTSIDLQPNFDDITVYREQFFVVDRMGIVSWINSSMNLIPFSPAISGSGDRKHLVTYGGELYLVDQYLIYKNPRCLGQTPPVNDVNKTVDFKVYRLDQECGRWEEVGTLPDAVFFLGVTSSFSLSTQGLAGCPGNRIYYTAGFTNTAGEADEFPEHHPKQKVYVFHLADHSINSLPKLPAYLQIGSWQFSPDLPLSPKPHLSRRRFYKYQRVQRISGASFQNETEGVYVSPGSSHHQEPHRDACISADK